MTVAANALVAGRFAWAPGGYALSFGRMLQDGIVKKYLDDHCPDAEPAPVPLQGPVAATTPTTSSGAAACSTSSAASMACAARCAGSRLRASPTIQSYRSNRCSPKPPTQLTLVETGAGVVKWVWDSYLQHQELMCPPRSRRCRPRARQQIRHRLCRHQPAAGPARLSGDGAAAAHRAHCAAPERFRRHRRTRRGRARSRILGNAAVFGTLATAHNRYGARMVWLAALVVMLALARLIQQRPKKRPGLPP